MTVSGESVSLMQSLSYSNLQKNASVKTNATLPEEIIAIILTNANPSIIVSVYLIAMKNALSDIYPQKGAKRLRRG